MKGLSVDEMLCLLAKFILDGMDSLSAVDFVSMGGVLCKRCHCADEGAARVALTEIYDSLFSALIVTDQRSMLRTWLFTGEASQRQVREVFGLDRWTLSEDYYRKVGSAMMSTFIALLQELKVNLSECGVDLRGIDYFLFVQGLNENAQQSQPSVVG